MVILFENFKCLQIKGIFSKKIRFPGLGAFGRINCDGLSRIVLLTEYMEEPTMQAKAMAIPTMT